MFSLVIQKGGYVLGAVKVRNQEFRKVGIIGLYWIGRSVDRKDEKCEILEKEKQKNNVEIEIS